jgi:hypothetical protein
MNHESEKLFDERLRGLLAAELDGQLGRAERRFLAGTATGRSMRMWWAVGIMAAAAALALVWMAWPAQPVGQPQISKQQDERKHLVVPANDAIASSTTAVPQKAIEVTQVRWYRTVDDGVVGTKDGVPVRRVRREVLDEVQTYDHTTDRVTRELRPEAEQVSYVQLTRF